MQQAQTQTQPTQPIQPTQTQPTQPTTLAVVKKKSIKVKIAIEGILFWIKEVPLSELQHLADNELPVRESVLRRFPLKYKYIADIAIGINGKKELANLSDIELETIITESLQRFPAKGLILWKHKEWSLKNIRQAINEYLSM
jgi:hypothetical protein